MFPCRLKSGMAETAIHRLTPLSGWMSISPLCGLPLALALRAKHLSVLQMGA
jgi:hypothetical protein